MESILVQANAKINLSLKILGKRKDGFHLIDSLFQSIDLADFLFIEKSKKNELTGAKICPDPQSIVFRAQKEMEKFCSKKLTCRIHLQKTIPVSAGLGGGSADAAALIFGLNKIYNLKLSPQKLTRIGLKIGADVPFFFYGGTRRVKGIGEKAELTKKKLPGFFVLFRPHKRIQTKKMYELYDKTNKSFLTLAKEICPDIKKVERYFSQFGLKLKMSGSGPTVFCETNDYRLAKKIAGGYSHFNGDIFICRPKNKALEIIK